MENYNEANETNQIIEQDDVQFPKTFEVEKQVVKEVKFPTRTEIDRAFKVSKINLDFTARDLKKLRDTTGFLSHTLANADEATKSHVLSAIEAMIESHHKNFSKTYKEFKKSSQSEADTFLKDFYVHCESIIKDRVARATEGSKERIEEVRNNASEVLNKTEFSQAELILIGSILKMSDARQKALIKSLAGSK